MNTSIRRITLAAGMAGVALCLQALLAGTPAPMVPGLCPQCAAWRVSAPPEWRVHRLAPPVGACRQQSALSSVANCEGSSLADYLIW
jgi:hypothetical protein